MNFIELESARKLRGGFYTDRQTALFLSAWVCKTATVVLEPGCGDGVFVHCVDTLQKNGGASVGHVYLSELDAKEAGKALARTSIPATLLSRDFLAWYLDGKKAKPRIDGILGNPPFIRYQYLPDSQQELAERLFASLGLKFTRHTNAWVPFVLAGLNLLAPGGRMALVIPSEIFHIPHAQALRDFILSTCSKALIIDPKAIWFEDTLQGTILLLAEKKREKSDPDCRFEIVSGADRSILERNADEIFRSAEFAVAMQAGKKWMTAFLDAGEKRLVENLRENIFVKKFTDLADVDVGIVTGANKFFLVSDYVVRKFKLDKISHRMFGRSEHVSGIIYTNDDHQNNRHSGLPVNFLWVREGDLDRDVKKYLTLGVGEKIPSRYKCRIRKNWYEVPSIYTAPVAMLKRAHNYPRLILNEADAYTTDTAYRIKPKGIDAKSFVFNFVNSLTCLLAELEGRHYGGGVLELVPSEIERLLIPAAPVRPSELRKADEEYRNMDSVDFLRRQDGIIFERIGLSRCEASVLFDAWRRMKERRQRGATE